MTKPNEFQSRIDQHLAAVRSHLRDKEDSVQNEIIDGLSDHINEALSRAQQPVTLEQVEAILAEMDDPSSYAEEPGVVGVVSRRGGVPGKVWLVVALAFLLVNAIGVWKLVEIDRRTAGDASHAPKGQIQVPHVGSDNTSGIRYPEAKPGEQPRQEAGGTTAGTEDKVFRSVAFMDNLNPVLAKPDQEVSWKFNVDVVDAERVGKTLEISPIKISPEVSGRFIWRTARDLVFIPEKPWALDQTFSAEMAGDVVAAGGEIYEGGRFWRFSTSSFSVSSFRQQRKQGGLSFNLGFTMPVREQSLSEKLKLHYTDSDGERHGLDYQLSIDESGTTATLDTAMVPAITIECDIESGLKPQVWSDGTREKVELRLSNNQLLSLRSMAFEPRAGQQPQLTLAFSDALAPADHSKFITISPKVQVTYSSPAERPDKLSLTGDFAPGVAYEVRIKRGLSSRGGRVLPVNTTRRLILPQSGVGVTQKAEELFETVVFNAGRQSVLESGKQELSWKFNCPVVGDASIGQTLAEPPIRITPELAGTFYWASSDELMFKPNLEWNLNQNFEARLEGKLVNLAGAEFTGLRFWTFSSPKMTILSAKQVTGRSGLDFALNFSMVPDRESMEKHLKVFCYDESGAKSYLEFDVLNTYYKNRTKTVRIPKGKTCKVHFELQPGFRPMDWKNGLTEGIELAAEISTVLRVQSVSASGNHSKVPSIDIQFSESVDVKTAEAFIEVNPPLKFTLQSHGNRENQISLHGPFVPNREYEVKVKAGLVSEQGFVLVDESVKNVRITRAASSLVFGGSGGYLSPEGSLLVPIRFQNLPNAKVSVAPVMASNLVHFARRNGSGYHYNLPMETDDDGYGGSRNIGDLIGHVTHKEINLSGEMNVETTDYLKLREFTKTKGAYLIQLRAQDPENENHYNRGLSDSRLVVITDLGLSAKTSDNSVFVWACSLKDAKPAGGVEVSAYSANNQLIGKAITNDDGVAAIACDVSDKNKRPFLVTAQLKDDLSYLCLEQSELHGDQTGSTRDYPSATCEAFVFTDRGIFRPGETLHARALIRKADFTAPEPFPVVFQIVKPDGRLFKELSAMPNEYGAVEVDVLMPEYLPTGRYSVRLRVPQSKENMGAVSVLLEDFVPPQIRVAVSTDKERYAQAEEISAELFAEHLFGAPAGGLKANVKCLYSQARFAPKSLSDYRFGANRVQFWGDRSDHKQFVMAPQDIEDLVLNGEGKVTANFEPKIPSNASGPIKVQVQASVFEQGGRAITSTKSALIDPYPFYIGVKVPGEGWFKPNETRKLSVVTVAPDASPFKVAKPLVLRIHSVKWHYNYKRGPDGNYTYTGHREARLIKEEALDLSTGLADYNLMPTSYGQYELSIEDPQSGSTFVMPYYVSYYQQSWTTSERERPDSLVLKFDKPDYRIGDTAKLTVQAPFAGTALLTIESDKVLLSRVILLEKNTAEVDIEVKEAYAPNVHCTLSVIRPAVAEAVWKGHRAFGSLPLRVSPRKHRIQVALEAPPSILPQSKLTTRVILKDDDGQPVNGEVTLIAVDEAICMLTSHRTPSPIDWLYELRRLGVDSSDVYSELMEVIDESVLKKKSHIGGDGEEMDGDGAAERLTKRLNPIKANRFKPVSLWASNITVTDGVADVDIDVPEFTGELRLMAVACNATQMGSAQGMVKVKRPLIVQASLPRFLAPTDECLMEVTVFNEMGEDITAKLQVTCGGPLSTKLNEQLLQIAKGGSVSVSIPVVAGKLPGKGLCTITCEAGTVKFNDTIEIAVRPPISAEVIADSGLLAPGKTIELRPPANWLPDSVQRRLQVSKEPMIEFNRSMKYLMRYPYGCLEQTTSASFPLLYLPDLAQRSSDKSMDMDATKDYVMAGVWRILSMQQADGSFSYWPDSNFYNTWAGIYATHFLVEAKKAGYEVPREPLDRALQAVTEGLNARRDHSGYHGNEYDLRAYACYVLAIAGQPEHSWQARMLEMKDKLSYYARLMNASALLAQGEPKRAVALLEELGLPGAGQRDLGGCFNSSTRNAALLLSAWLDIDPKNEEVIKLVEVLNKSKTNGRWGTTQENAFGLMAMGKYCRRMKLETTDFKAMVTLPDGTSEAFDHRVDRKWLIERQHGGAVILTNQGPGNLYYTVESEGVPIDLPEYYQKLTAQSKGVSVTRDWLDDEGRPLDINTLKQNQLVVVKVSLNTRGQSIDNLAIEDLLPAGLEVENPNLDTTQTLPWVTANTDWCKRRDIRDDRVLLFTGSHSGTSSFYYLARAVTPGKFIVPPITAECMYDPEIRSITSQSVMTISK